LLNLVLATPINGYKFPTGFVNPQNLRPKFNLPDSSGE